MAEMPSPNDNSLNPDTTPTPVPEQPPDTTPDAANNSVEPPATASEPAAAAPPELADTVPAAAAPTVPKKRTRLWVLLIVLLAVAAGALAYLFVWSKPAATTNAIARHDIPLLRYGYNNNPLNDFYPDPNAVNGPLEMNEQVFEGLVRFQNGTQIAPNLAASWTNPDDSTWVFKLKPNVYFHDGNTLTAQDVVKTWQVVAAQNSALSAYTVNTIKDVQAVDNLTVKITTTAPDPILLNRLAYLWIVDSKAPATAKPWDVATGPYTVKQGTTPTADAIKLVAFSKWHGGHIYTKEVDYTFYSDQDKAASDLAAGKIDIGDNLSLSGASALPKTRFTTYDRPQLYVFGLVLNTNAKDSPTSNIKVRQAIALAIDPQAALKGSGYAGKVASQVIPPQVPGYDPAIKPITPNVAKAKQLLQAAGYPNGFTLSFGYGAPEEAVSKVITADLQAIGITVNAMRADDEGTYFNNINNGVYKAFLQGQSTELIDASDIFAAFQSLPYYNDPAFDAKVTQADKTFNASERLKLLQQASDILSQDYVEVPLYGEDIIFSANKSLHVPLDLYDNDIDAYFADVSQQ